jgi:hypothetical protein
MTRAAALAEARAGLCEVVQEANREVYLLAVDGGAAPDEELELACACGRPSCAEHVLITVEAYLRVHADPGRFVVSPGHADRGTTAVLDGGDAYDVVCAVSATRTSS